MIFLRYESFRSYLKMYPVTSVLLGANLLMFLVLTLTGGSTDPYNLLNWGAFYQHSLHDPYGLNEPWRFITSVFLHIGFQHLLFNCFSLLVFAPPLERLLGHLKYLIFYLLCGVAGNVLSVVMSTGIVVSAGASGAIYGVFGAFLHIVLLQKHTLDEASRKTVITILVIGVLYSIFVPSINLWAHVGGGFAGFALYGLFQNKKHK